MSFPLLAISDGTTTISLLSRIAFTVTDWQPARPEKVIAGAGSPLRDGKQPISLHYQYVKDVLTLCLRHHSMDLAIRECRKLDVLLTQAIEYWTMPSRLQPVYLVAKGSNETQTRYATIVSYKFPHDSNPYATPLFSHFGKAGMEGLQLELEHTAWQDAVPGTVGTCVQISGQEEADVLNEHEYESAASADDCEVNRAGAGAIVLNGITIRIGDVGGAAQYDAGLRFTNVTVPVGATIVYAMMRLRSVNNQANVTVNLRVYGDASAGANPATFSTYANYTGRTRSTAFATWVPAAWTGGPWYETPNLATVITEIIALAGWASGNNLALFIQNNVSTANAYRDFGSFDGGASEPELWIWWTTGMERTEGQEATCNRDVRIVNYHVNGQITHAFAYDATAPGTYSTNLIGAAVPYALFPAAPAAGDCLYLGMQAGASWTAPFDNVVFDIGTVAGVGTIVWEYNTGVWPAAPAWAALATVVDRTVEFTVIGQGGVSWNSYPTALNIVNRVMGIWVRARISTLWVFTTPTQKVKDVYSCRWNFINVDDAQVDCDLPALIRNTLLPGCLDIGRCVVGLRSLDRGADFRTWFTAGAGHNPPGVTYTLLNVSASLVTGLAIPQGTYTRWDPAAIAMTTIGYWTIPATIMSQFEGRYRVFVRGSYNMLTTGRIRLGFGYASGAMLSVTKAAELNTRYFWDLGTLSISLAERGVTETLDALYLYLQGETDGADGTLLVTDVCLMPVDEWCEDMQMVRKYVTDLFGRPVTYFLGIDTSHVLVADSVMVQRRMGRVYGVTVANETVISHGGIIDPALPMFLQPHRDQRLWYFLTRPDSTLAYAHTAYGAIHADVQLTGARRYQSMRGAT